MTVNIKKNIYKAKYIGQILVLKVLNHTY